MMGAVEAPPGQPAEPAGGDPFEQWCRLRASEGERVSMIRLYAMVAGPRGLRAHELPPAERRAAGRQWAG
jgi:hypothetical protein